MQRVRGRWPQRRLLRLAGHAVAGGLQLRGGLEGGWRGVERGGRRLRRARLQRLAQVRGREDRGAMGRGLVLLLLLLLHIERNGVVGVGGENGGGRRVLAEERAARLQRVVQGPHEA